MTRGEGADLPSSDTPSAPSAGRRFWINTVTCVPQLPIGFVTRSGMRVQVRVAELVTGN